MRCTVRTMFSHCPSDENSVNLSGRGLVYKVQSYLLVFLVSPYASTRSSHIRRLISSCSSRHCRCCPGCYSSTCRAIRSRGSHGATPLPSSWQTTGCTAAGGHLSCVSDMRYRSHRKVKRLFPTLAAGLIWPIKAVWKPLRNGGATLTILLQYGTNAPVIPFGSTVAVAAPESTG